MQHNVHAGGEGSDIAVFRFTLGIPGFDDALIPRVVGVAGALLILANHVLDRAPASEAQVLTACIPPSCHKPGMRQLKGCLLACRPGQSLWAACCASCALPPPASAGGCNRPCRGVGGRSAAMQAPRQAGASSSWQPTSQRTAGR